MPTSSPAPVPVPVPPVSAAHPAPAATPAEAFARDGAWCVPDLLPAEPLAALRAAFAAPLDHEDGRRAGVRGLLDPRRFPQAAAVRALAVRPEVWGLAAELIGPDAVAVRATLFDKSPGANWGVMWHRDERVELADRVASPPWTAWKRADGRWTARPPHEFLLKMVALRVHLDDCGPDAGPLRVRPGSHRLAAPAAAGDAGEAVGGANVGGGAERACVVPAGGAVAMCPATLHASGWARFSGAGTKRRRVIHLEYAPPVPPGGARWPHALRPSRPS
ncbi:phytanoyl-CoA dioxygenase family protein, partial [Alienimonas sp. DA493]|uniref:phytanoyl-CoA dioxygenase family protein n=1 Tax=Alienimonas sp. DA493 TaxID=3373605 RepID=UPI0037540D37